MKENRKEIDEKEYVKKENKKGRFGKWEKTHEKQRSRENKGIINDTL